MAYGRVSSRCRISCPGDLRSLESSIMKQHVVLGDFLLAAAIAFLTLPLAPVSDSPVCLIRCRSVDTTLFVVQHQFAVVTVAPRHQSPMTGPTVL